MSAAYSFVTLWRIPASVERVWAEIVNPDDWPSWWRGVERVETLRTGRPDGVGTIRRYTWRSRLPYRLIFTLETTRIEPCILIEGMAAGELEGRGLWQLTPAGTGTDVRYNWDVTATKPWMKLLSPIARPIFAWNHDIVMEWGRQGLVKRISAL